MGKFHPPWLSTTFVRDVEDYTVSYNSNAVMKGGSRFGLRLTRQTIEESHRGIAGPLIAGAPVLTEATVGRQCGCFE